LFVISCRQQYGKSYWCGSDKGLGAKSQAIRYESKEAAEAGRPELGAFLQMKRQLRIDRYMPNYSQCVVEPL